MCVPSRIAPLINGHDYWWFKVGVKIVYFFLEFILINYPNLIIFKLNKALSNCCHKYTYNKNICNKGTILKGKILCFQSIQPSERL